MKLPATVLFVLVASVPAFGQTCVSPPDGLVSWWPAEGDATDVVGGNHGSPNNSSFSYTSGQVGLGFDFRLPAPGPNPHYVEIPDSDSLDIDDAITLMSWVRIDGDVTDSLGIGRSPVVLGKWDNRQPSGSFTIPADESYELSYLRDSATSFRPVCCISIDGTGATSQCVVSAPGDTVDLGQWHLLTGTYDSSTGELKVYVNGDLKGTLLVLPVGQKIHKSVAPLVIGREDPDSDIHTFNGLIDEPAIFHRALSQAEIAAVYAAGSAGMAQDSDGDGLGDCVDECPGSDLGDTIVLDGEDTGVSNDLLDTGCTIADLIGEFLAQNPSMSQIVDLLISLKANDVITGREMGAILKTLNSV